MVKQIALLHFSGPPGIGGVEAVMHHQARVLTGMGYPVRVVSGTQTPPAERLDAYHDPRFSSTHPDVLAVKAELDRGQVTSRFHDLRAAILVALRAALAQTDVCIAHNVPSLHKNLALTSALHQLATEGAPRIIAWCHDMAWTNPLYSAELYAGEPWDLLRSAWVNTRYVTISESRRMELATLLALPAQKIHIVPGGIDPAGFLRLTPAAARLAERLRLYAADAILLYPTRLTRRKNIELALRVLAELRAQSGRDFRLLVTGPPGPHNPSNARYLADLLELRISLHLEDSAHFAYTCGDDADVPLMLSDADVASLYALSDALLFTTEQEGFGIPILEAGLAGIPIFCTDIAPLREIARQDAIYFNAEEAVPGAIAEQIWMALAASPRYRLRSRVRQNARWEMVIERDLIPLLEAT